MKLRILGNTLRLRLNRSDVQRFAEAGFVEETTRFGPAPEQCFNYRIERHEGAHELRADLFERRISIQVPSASAIEWVETTRVGMTAEQRIDGTSTLIIHVEKDFQCLAPRDDGDSEGFPNPNRPLANRHSDEDNVQ